MKETRKLHAVSLLRSFFVQIKPLTQKVSCSHKPPILLLRSSLHILACKHVLPHQRDSLSKSVILNTGSVCVCEYCRYPQLKCIYKDQFHLGFTFSKALLQFSHYYLCVYKSCTLLMCTYSQKCSRRASMVRQTQRSLIQKVI